MTKQDPHHQAGVSRSPARGMLRRVLLVASVVCGLALAVFIVRRVTPEPTHTVRSSETIVTAVRSLARLETASMRLQKVVDLQDQQSRLWGAVVAKDAILLIATADVRAGVDLAGVGPDSVTVDDVRRVAVLTLPRAEVFSVALNSKDTYVYSRTTEVLARHNPQLETRARNLAEEMLSQSARESDIVQTAERNAERVVRALLLPLGFAEVEVRWQDSPAVEPSGKQ